MKVSIITVCLNSERTIEQTIQSVINQNDSNYEYIIIDGKSTDKTLDIIEKYRNKTMKVISEADGGIYDAMNKGIALASGDVIGIINSDDWYEPEVFKNIRKCFQETNAEVVYGKMNLIHDNKKSEILTPSDIEKIRYQMEIPHPTVFIRKKIYEKYGKFQLKYKIAADYELILRLYTSGVRFIHLDRVIANYRIGGISAQRGLECIEETLSISQRYLSYVPLEKRRDVKKIILHRVKAFYFERMITNFPDKIWNILNEKLGVRLEDDIVIFGAGNWGIKAFRELQKKGIRPLFLVDNDKNKWVENGDDVHILSPENLKTYSGIILVLVRDFVSEILLQIENMGVREIYCITWEDMVICLRNFD